MKLKKALCIGTAAVLSLALLAGCGGESKDSGESKKESKKIVVGASPSPHAEILKEVQPILEEKGYKLEIKEYSDYVIPNTAVEEDEIDANYFQHITYMNNFNEERGTHLVSAGEIHYEPFGIYPGTTAKLEDLKDGDKIAVPNDTTNEARALLLLESQGIITLKDGAGLNATKKDIEENPHNVEIVELEAAQIPRVLSEVAFACMNGNYALDAGYTAEKDALVVEDASSDAVKAYVNVIAVKEGNENNDAVKALVEALKSDDVKTYIDKTYNGAVVVVE